MTIKVEKKTRRNGLRYSSRSFLILLIASMALHFLTLSIAAEDATQTHRGESGLSKHPWQIGVFVQGGFPPTYKEYIFGTNLYYDEQLEIFSAGLEIGKQTRRFYGLRQLRGRGEALLDVVPFWLARYPPQTVTAYNHGVPIPGSSLHWNGSNIYGGGVTPLLRWNFSQRDAVRIVPWAQFGGGIQRTGHQFPDSSFSNSAINFTPQVGAGVNIFNRPRHSVNFAMKAIHYSNAGLGDFNPGVKLTFQFSAGYSWWR
jgi:lipid A 3-O-deacylase